MRIVTWNMAYWTHRARYEEAWTWLLDKLDPDVALCQECVPTDWVRQERSVVWERAYPSSRQPWGTAVVSRSPARAVRLPEVDDWFAQVPTALPGETEPCRIHRADGWIAAAEVDFSGGSPTTAISVHSPAYPVEAVRLSGVDISRMKLRLNPDLWLLDVLFFFLRPRLTTQLVVGGDFNYSRLLDDLHGATGNHEFFDRVASEGFVSLHRLFHSCDEQTFFQKGKSPRQLDYLYADGASAKLARSCEIVPYAQVSHLSDHAPLMAVLADSEAAERSEQATSGRASPRMSRFVAEDLIIVPPDRANS